jgi:hypothetical protein
LSIALDKPIIYFSSKSFNEEPGEDELSVLEQELFIQARKLSRDDLLRLVSQTKALADLSKGQ